MNGFRKRHLAIPLALLSITALVSACSSAGASPSAAGPTGTQGATTQIPAVTQAASPTVDPNDPCAQYAVYGKYPGTKVTMYSAIVAPEDASYIASLKKFQQCTGITVEFQGDKEFDTQIMVRIQGGNAPDVAVFAQPGVVQKLAKDGKILEAPASVSANVDKWWSPSWRPYATVDGKLYGAPLGAKVLSLVWYSPKEFAAKGYTVPKTLDELKALSDKIAATGQKPWCAGIASGDATGWGVTDWMEDFMLRLFGPDTFDKWVNHQIPFNGTEATAALDAAGAYLKNPAYVNGGLGDVKSIATTNFWDAGLPILKNQCSMMKQGSFYGQMWPKGTNVAPDGDVFAFYFPSINETTKPVEGGGEFLVAFSNRPEVQAFQTFMSSDTWANEKVANSQNGGWVSANKGLDVSKLATPIDKLVVQILQDPKTVFRFDGSDQMPPAVGTAAFWQQGTKWIIGQSTADTLNAIEKAWPN